MKKTIAMALTVVLVFSLSISLPSGMLIANAASVTENEIVFETGTGTITDYTGSASTLDIPSTINGFAVTSIGGNAFSDCNSLISVTIPGSVTSIGVTAFLSCTSLSNITIGSSVTSIGDFAFYFCTSLTSVTIPANVTSIGVSAFVCGNSLISINVDAANLNYSSANGVLYDKNKTVLVEYPSGISGSVTIPSSVTSIGNSAFEMCNLLTSIIIPDGVTSIGDSVFRDCELLTSIIIPNSVTSIGDNAFSQCKSLTRVTIPNSVTSIGMGAFRDCNLLTSIIIPNSVTSIGRGAFEMCFSLTIYGYEGSYAQTYAAESMPPIPFSTDLPNIKQCVMEYNIDPTYTVIIPESVTIGESGGTIEIKGSNINTLPDETVYVKISIGIGANGLISLTNQSDSITSTVSNSEGAINTNTVVASFEGMITDETIGGTLNLSKPADTSNKRAGTYTGTLTFAIAMGILS